MLKNLIFSTLSIILSCFLTLVIIELTLQFFPNILGYDIRQQSDVYFDNIKKHKNLSFALTPKYLKNQNNTKNFLSLSGISNSVTINCNENGYWSILKSDKYGFNNDNNLWKDKKIDYVFLGDSFTYGSCVNNKDVISNVFKSLTKKKVVNLGIPGSGPLLQFGIMREYLPKIKVNKLIWVFFEGNDIIDFKVNLKNDLAKKYISNPYFSQNLVKNQKIIDKILIDQTKNYIRRIEEKRRLPYWFFYRTKMVIKNSFLKLHKNIEQEPESQNSELDEIKNQLKDLYYKASKYLYKNNIDLYFVFVPDQSRYDKSIISKTLIPGDHVKVNTVNKKQLFELLSSLNIKIIDTDNVFKKKWKNFYAVKGISSHLNENGYRALAHIISNQLNIKSD